MLKSEFRSFIFNNWDLKNYETTNCLINKNPGSTNLFLEEDKTDN